MGRTIKVTISRKEDNIEYVAFMTQLNQCPNCKFTIKENEIVYRKDERLIDLYPFAKKIIRLIILRISIISPIIKHFKS